MNFYFKSDEPWPKTSLSLGLPSLNCHNKIFYCTGSSGLMYTKFRTSSVYSVRPANLYITRLFKLNIYFFLIQSENMDEQIGQLEDLLTVLMEEKKNLEDKQNSMAEEYSEIRSGRKKIAEEEETPDFQSPEEETYAYFIFV